MRPCHLLATLWALGVSLATALPLVNLPPADYPGAVIIESSPTDTAVVAVADAYTTSVALQTSPPAVDTSTDVSTPTAAVPSATVSSTMQSTETSVTLAGDISFTVQEGNTPSATLPPSKNMPVVTVVQVVTLTAGASLTETAAATLVTFGSGATPTASPSARTGKTCKKKTKHAKASKTYGSKAKSPSAKSSKKQTPAATSKPDARLVADSAKISLTALATEGHAIDATFSLGQFLSAFQGLTVQGASATDSATWVAALQASGTSATASQIPKFAASLGSSLAASGPILADLVGQMGELNIDFDKAGPLLETMSLVDVLSGTL
ncbi:hypothetical protein HKX48_001833 [Thoreauomyces humboldtii]|nr:hypothetical protein HKX48_001833 [Thoreauomyces humboldtii]